MRFKDKVAVITGSARGIGRASAEIMAREGGRVVITDRDGDAAATTAREIGEATIAVAADVANPDEIVALFERTEAAFGHVDILVNNAGVGSPHLVLDIGLEEWERVIRVNLTGAMLASQQAARRMIARGKGGRIVNITSLAAQRGITGRSAYGASKAGLDILTKILALELAEHRINVNAVAPGAISTEMSRGMHTKETKEAYERVIPQRRYGTPEEVAAGIVFLASDDASHITGHTLNVDGGFLAAGLMFDFDPTKHKPLGSA